MEIIIQEDREAACDILERWGGIHNSQVIMDTQTGRRDLEDGFAGDLVRAFAAHRTLFSPSREAIDDLFNEALNEHGAQGYGRDTPAQKTFTEVVSKLQRDVTAVLSTRSKTFDLDDLAKALYWAEVKQGDRDNRVQDDARDEWWNQNANGPFSGPSFVARWRAIATAAINMFEHDADA
jgi:hypothetical protein